MLPYYISAQIVLLLVLLFGGQVVPLWVTFLPAMVAALHFGTILVVFVAGAIVIGLMGRAQLKDFRKE